MKITKKIKFMGIMKIQISLKKKSLIVPKRKNIKKVLLNSQGK